MIIKRNGDALAMEATDGGGLRWTSAEGPSNGRSNGRCPWMSTDVQSPTISL